MEHARLKHQDWDGLYAQFTRTPDPGEGFTETGEHWQLIALLNRLSFNPYSRQVAERLSNFFQLLLSLPD